MGNGGGGGNIQQVAIKTSGRPAGRREQVQGPSLGGLAGHAPYFHNGSAATLEDIIDAYQAAGFQFNFTPQSEADIVAFLKSL